MPCSSSARCSTERAGPALTGHVDTRFTRIGRLLAKTKLDELPQLWNVLRGEMSLVGPRPEDPYFVALHATEYDEILQCPPGITGLCQLAFASESRDPRLRRPRRRTTSTAILPQKVQLDVLYASS